MREGADEKQRFRACRGSLLLVQLQNNKNKNNITGKDKQATHYR